MWNKREFKKIRGLIPFHVASTDSTSFDSTSLRSTTLCLDGVKVFGANYMVTLTAWSTAHETTDNEGIYILPSTVVPTAANSFFLPIGESIDMMIENACNILGGSSNTKFSAIIWE